MKRIINIIFKLIVTFILLIFSLLGLGFLYLKTNNFSISSNFNINEDLEKQKTTQIDFDTYEEIDYLAANTETQNEVEDWKLVLVNSDNPLPDNFTIELAKISGAKEFDSRAATELLEMIQAMKDSGASNIWIQSAYRTPEHQERLYQNKVQDFLAMGKNRQDAEILASKWVNKSETSEHNLGLAVDFNDIKKEFENTKEFAWLVKNAEEFGFILRYPKDKKDITKVNYEPWHWRYVGVEHAKEINKLGYCLEEYIEYLENKKQNEY